jgi:hypothetical protein
MLPALRKFALMIPKPTIRAASAMATPGILEIREKPAVAD